MNNLPVVNGAIKGAFGESIRNIFPISWGAGRTGAAFTEFPNPRFSPKFGTFGNGRPVYLFFPFGLLIACPGWLKNFRHLSRMDGLAHFSTTMKDDLKITSVWANWNPSLRVFESYPSESLGKPRKVKTAATEAHVLGKAAGLNCCSLYI